MKLIVSIQYFSLLAEPFSKLLFVLLLILIFLLGLISYILREIWIDTFN